MKKQLEEIMVTHKESRGNSWIKHTLNKILYYIWVSFLRTEIGPELCNLKKLLIHCCHQTRRGNLVFSTVYLISFYLDYQEKIPSHADTTALHYTTLQPTLVHYTTVNCIQVQCSVVQEGVVQCNMFRVGSVMLLTLSSIVKQLQFANFCFINGLFSIQQFTVVQCTRVYCSVVWCSAVVSA